MLVGDAFATTCPATGTGLTRLLLDVELLARLYTTDWIRTPGMSAEKIRHYYQHPAKVATDQEGLRRSHYMRNASTEPDWTWRLHRWQVWQRKRLGALLGWPCWLTLHATRPIIKAFDFDRHDTLMGASTVHSL